MKRVAPISWDQLEELDRPLYNSGHDSLNRMLLRSDRALYRRDRSEAHVVLPEENYERFIRALRSRRARRRPVVIVIDGKETGVGKSALGLDVCRKLDPGFSLEKVVYSAQELSDAFARVEPSMILYDEGTLGLLANKGSRDDEARAIIAGTSIMRKNGHGLILTVPKKELLDSLLTSGLANLWVFVEAPGRARVFLAWRGALFKRSQPRYPFDEWSAINPITWPNPDGDEETGLPPDPFFLAYNDRAKLRNRQWFQLRALDPSGRLRRCDACGKLGSAYVIATHLCPGSSAAAAGSGSPLLEAVTPRTNKPKRGGAPVIGGPLRCSRCGRSFDNEHNLNAHRCPGRGAREK
jgi:hypothetical protein